MQPGVSSHKQVEPGASQASGARRFISKWSQESHEQLYCCSSSIFHSSSCCDMRRRVWRLGSVACRDAPLASAWGHVIMLVYVSCADYILIEISIGDILLFAFVSRISALDRVSGPLAFLHWIVSRIHSHFCVGSSRVHSNFCVGSCLGSTRISALDRVSGPCLRSTCSRFGCCFCFVCMTVGLALSWIRCCTYFCVSSILPLFDYIILPACVLALSPKTH